jgi:ribosomal protein L37AE/L43A
MNTFKNYKLLDNTKFNRKRDILKERKIIIYCNNCKIGIITYEASTIFKCDKCDSIPKISFT